MNKKSIAAIILFSVFAGMLVNVLFGRWLTAKLSLLPVLNRWKIIQPQTPIIIERREEVRVSDSGDVSQAAQEAKSRISAVFKKDHGQLVLAGTAVNLTQDGTFASAEPTFAATGVEYIVMLSDGRFAGITKTLLNRETGVVFFSAPLTNVSVAAFGVSESLAPGERIFFLNASTRSHLSRFEGSFVTQAQNDPADLPFNADEPTRTFFVQHSGLLTPGEAVVNLKAETVGMWNGERLVSADVLKQLTAIYLSNQGNLPMPAYGFTYKPVVEIQKNALALPLGAQVVEIKPNAKAAKAGLLAGDIIVKVNGNAVTEDEVLEEFLQRMKPGENATFDVVRKGQAVRVTFTVE